MRDTEIKEYVEMARKRCYANGIPSEDAIDMATDAFMWCYSHFDSSKGAKFSTYLYNYTTFLIKHYFSRTYPKLEILYRLRKQPSTEIDSKQFIESFGSYEPLEKYVELMNAIEKLSEPAKRLIESMDFVNYGGRYTWRAYAEKELGISRRAYYKIVDEVCATLDLPRPAPRKSALSDSAHTG